MEFIYTPVHILFLGFKEATNFKIFLGFIVNGSQFCHGFHKPIGLQSVSGFHLNNGSQISMSKSNIQNLDIVSTIINSAKYSDHKYPNSQLFYSKSSKQPPYITYPQFLHTQSSATMLYIKHFSHLHSGHGGIYIFTLIFLVMYHFLLNVIVDITLSLFLSESIFAQYSSSFSYSYSNLTALLIALVILPSNGTSTVTSLSVIFVNCVIAVI